MQPANRPKSRSRIGDMRLTVLRSDLLAALVGALVAAFAVVAMPVVAAASVVKATLEPAEIAVGHSALLTITTLGTGTEPMVLPFVGGLEFRIVSQSHRFETTNGMKLTTTTIVVRVTPQMVGTFTIPVLAPQSEPLMLRVDPDRLPASSSSSIPRNASGLPPVIARPLAESGIHLMAEGAAFVRLGVPKRQAYVGESIPIEIEVGLRPGFVTAINGLPTLTGGDFTLNNLSRQPERSERNLAGKPFSVFTWHSVMAAVKPGSFAFSVEMPLTVRFSTRPKADAQLDDLLGDPFLQNHFGPTVTKDVKVSSPRSELTVIALPTEDRPADFSGAVGTFTISSDVAPATAAAGDPMNLRLQVIGSGNFDRVDSAMLRSLDRWKTYPPRSSFNATDPLGYKGEKIFEQPVIASDPGVQILPALAFSFFDPTTGRYQTARSAPLTVTISKALADTTLAAPVPGAAPARGPPGGGGGRQLAGGGGGGGVRRRRAAWRRGGGGGGGGGGGRGGGGVRRRLGGGGDKVNKERERRTEREREREREREETERERERNSRKKKREKRERDREREREREREQERERDENKRKREKRQREREREREREK